MPRLLLCTAFAVMGGMAHGHPSGYDDYQVVRITITTEEELETLRELQDLGRNFQVWSEGVGIGPIDVRVAPAAKPALDASGLFYEVTIRDLQRHIDELYRAPRDGGFFDALRTYEEHVQFMTDLVATYPDLAEMVLIGTSVKGRSMWALRITGPGGDKPGVMYHGAQHGFEQAGASVVAYTANHLLTSYDSDPEVAALVDNVEWFLLPIMNPDGYVYYDRWNANAVDLNRNWGGPGSGEDFTGGPYPFSEPETAAMRDFFLAHSNVRVHVDLHGYVNWIMWPWAHTPDWCVDHWTFHILGSEVHDRIEAGGGGSYIIGTVWDVAYAVYGGSVNYTYGELGLWGFTYELQDDDLPEICEEFLSSMLFLAEWISDCNANNIPDVDDIVAGTSADCNDNDVPDECESQADCNDDGVLDICDFAGSDYPDCNTNAIPDACDIESEISEDCTGNAIPDECEPDCNGNGVGDSCDIAGETSQDCNANDVPDECEPDCNDNGIADACDIDEGTSQDEDQNDVPDECRLLLFVNAAAPPGGDGMSWPTAYQDLQDALAEAAPNTFSRIWVAAATYTPAPPGGSRTATFQLMSGVAIYGGFTGVEISLDERDPVANVTILSGDLDGDDGRDFTGYNENSCHVVTASGTDATAILDGFTITAGNAYHPCETFDGGGMYNIGGSPTLSNCTFSGNLAYDGAGMYNSDYASPVLTNCTFAGNSAGSRGSRGGGVYNEYHSNPMLTNCTFSGNSAGRGGGMYNLAGRPTLTGCTFSGNSTAGYGAAMYNSASSPTLENCIFTDNSGGKGGAISNGGGSPKLTKCVFSGNVANSDGGGMYNSSSSPALTSCVFSGNVAGYDGGGMRNFNATPWLRNCVFAGNSANCGGAVYNSNSYSTLAGCTFTGNLAPNGGALACDSVDQERPSTVVMSNAILWDNTDALWNNDGSAITITYSDVQDGWTGEGNIDVDPLFVDADGPDDIPGTEDDNLRLSLGSPCINTGDPGYVPEPGETDLDGHARVLCDRVDMGAYEFGIGDYDCDRFVTLADFTAWEACMTGPEAGPYADGCEAFDFEYDGDVDIQDFAALEITFNP